MRFVAEDWGETSAVLASVACCSENSESSWNGPAHNNMHERKDDMSG